MKPHPATQLAAWCAFAIVVQRLPLAGLALVALIVLPLAWLRARERAARLLWRARWLLLAIAVLFIAATPGERLPAPLGALGLSHDGLRLAAEHLLRLVALLATLAWLLHALGRAGLLASLYCLLAPCGQGLRERIVVRLLLAIDAVEGGAGRDWRTWLSEEGAQTPPQSTLQLAVPALRQGDRAALAALFFATLFALALT